MGSNDQCHRTRTRFGYLEAAIVCLIGGLVVLIVVKTVWRHQTPPQNTSWDDYNRITLGMSRGEVEAILGKGFDNTPVPANDVLPRVDFHLEEQFLLWANPGEEIDVHFQEGKVIHKCYWKGRRCRHREPEPWDCEWDRLQRDLDPKNVQQRE